jgi:hypothetical protein
MAVTLAVWPCREGVKLIHSVLLVAMLACLPSIDLLWCPDGCGDADCLQLSMHGDSSSRTGTCGLCLNGVAVHRDVPMPAPVSHSLAAPSFVTPALALVPPNQIDRPPRL